MSKLCGGFGTRIRRLPADWRRRVSGRSVAWVLCARQQRRKVQRGHRQTKADGAGSRGYFGANNERGGGGAQDSGKASLDKADRGELSNIVSLVREK